MGFELELWSWTRRGVRAGGLEAVSDTLGRWWPSVIGARACRSAGLNPPPSSERYLFLLQQKWPSLLDFWLEM